MIGRGLALGMALMLAASGAALACQGKGQGNAAAAVLDDSFKIPDPGWGPADQAASFTARGLALKPPVNGSAWRWNQNYMLDKGALCVEVVNPARTSIGGDSGDVGIRFWAQDGQNFYTATVALDGTAAIDRLVNGRWHNIVPPTATGAVHTRPGAVNELEITLNGDAGAFVVNGVKISDFRGDPPPRGGPPGVYAESGASEVSWVFPRVQLF